MSAADLVVAVGFALMYCGVLHRRGDWKGRVGGSHTAVPGPSRGTGSGLRPRRGRISLAARPQAGRPAGSTALHSAFLSRPPQPTGPGGADRRHRRPSSAACATTQLRLRRRPNTGTLPRGARPIPGRWYAWLDAVPDDERDVDAVALRAAVEHFGVTGGEDRYELLITHNFVIGWFVRHVLDAPEWRWIGLGETIRARSRPGRSRRSGPAVTAPT